MESKRPNTMFYIVLLCAVIISCMNGCTYNRNSPLIEHNAPFIDSDITTRDVTVPVVP